MSTNPWGQSSMSDARALAAKAIAAVFKGKSLDAGLAATQRLSARDAGFAKTLAFGVLREHRALCAVLRPWLEKPLPPDNPTHALLCVGLFQLLHLGTPAHAAVAATVEACEALGQPRAKGLVNALLRRCLREYPDAGQGQPSDYQAALTNPAERLSHAAWMADAISKDWGGEANALMLANNQHPPMTLRVNTQRIATDDYAAQLASAGIAATRIDGLDAALQLAEPVSVSALPGFDSGLCSVQDASAQWAAHLLDARADQRVLDACAAPGGKTAHALERCANLQMTALDHDPARLSRVADTLARLGLSAKLLCADAADTGSWWDGQRFDRILLDAPCSGTGVIRRHPDIKWLRRASDIPALASKQAGLLAALWPTLKPGGRLLYATCSVLKAEGAQVVDAFVAATEDARALPLTLPVGEASGCGWRIRAGGGFDGFFYALLEKVG